MIRRVLLTLCGAAALGVAFEARLNAQQHAGSMTPADIEAGARLYGAQCSSCHGTNGNQVAGVDTHLEMDFVEGRRFMGGRARSATPPLSRGPINTWTEEAGHGAVLALDPLTGTRQWAFTMHDVTDSGILTTSTDPLFSGGREGYFYALDARTGTLLWKATVGGQIAAGPISYQVDRKQYIAIAAGHSLFAYGLRE